VTSSHDNPAQPLDAVGVSPVRLLPATVMANIPPGTRRLADHADIRGPDDRPGVARPYCHIILRPELPDDVA
jgi:hypothetical protein